MTGYLARLAARAAGAPATVEPRLPARFESPAVFDSAEPAAPVASETGAARYRAAAPGVARRPPARRDAAAHRDAASSPAPPVTGARPEAAPERTEARAETTAAATLRAQSVAPTDPKPPAEPIASSSHSPALAPTRAEPLPATRVEAAPLPRAADAQLPSVAGDDSPRSTREPDVVVVTIGRVEVRATVATPPAPRPAARPPRDSERSLHEYLSGRTR